MKYFSKSLCDLDELSLLLTSVRSTAANFPSPAEDSGTDLRHSKFVLQKLLNTIGGLQGYSVEQFAAAVLGYLSSYTTETSSYCYVWPAAKSLGGIATRAGFDEGDSDTEADSGSETDGERLDLRECLSDDDSDSDSADRVKKKPKYITRTSKLVKDTLAGLGVTTGASSRHNPHNADEREFEAMDPNCVPDIEEVQDDNDAEGQAILKGIVFPKSIIIRTTTGAVRRFIS